MQQGVDPDVFTLMSYSSTCFVLKTCNLTDSIRKLGELYHYWEKNLIFVQFICSIYLPSNGLVWTAEQSYIHPKSALGCTYSITLPMKDQSCFLRMAILTQFLTTWPEAWGMQRSPVSHGLQSLALKMSLCFLGQGKSWLRFLLLKQALVSHMSEKWYQPLSIGIPPVGALWPASVQVNSQLNTILV